MAEVVLKDIYKEYVEGIPVVQEFNLEIQDKEFVVFLGPSGCARKGDRQKTESFFDGRTLK